MGSLLGSYKKIWTAQNNSSFTDNKTQKALEKNKTKNKAKKAEKTKPRIKWQKQK